MKKSAWLLLTLLGLQLVVAGCGYKGDLYLPGQEQSGPARPRTVQPVP